MLFSLYPIITHNYFLLCFVVCLGILQWSAARHHRLSISLLGPWGLGRPGIIIGTLLVITAFSSFFLFTPGLLITGLAGGELSTLFGAGCATALVATRLSATVWQKLGDASTSKE